MAKLMDYCDGVQHIGIPAGDLAATCKFYEELGFENVHQAEFGEGPQHVCFLKYQNLVLECYDEAQRVLVSAEASAFDGVDCGDTEEFLPFSGANSVEGDSGVLLPDTGSFQRRLLQRQYVRSPQYSDAKRSQSCISPIPNSSVVWPTPNVARFHRQHGSSSSHCG